MGRDFCKSYLIVVFRYVKSLYLNILDWNNTNKHKTVVMSSTFPLLCLLTPE